MEAHGLPKVPQTSETQSRDSTQVAPVKPTLPVLWLPLNELMYVPSGSRLTPGTVCASENMSCGGLVSKMSPEAQGWYNPFPLRVGRPGTVMG